MTWPCGDVKLLTAKGAANGLGLGHVLLCLQENAEACEPINRKQDLALGCERLWQAYQLLDAKLALEGKVDCQTAILKQNEVIHRHVNRWVQGMTQALTAVSPLLAPRVAGQPKVVYQPLVGSVQGHWVMWPTHWPSVVADLLVASLKSWTVLACSTPNEPHLDQAVGRDWLQRTAAVKQRLPTGMNIGNILAAARCKDIPALWVEADVMQLGYGHRARWWRSTVTDATPALSMSQARDKTRTNRLLKAAGLPVPHHVEVPDEDAAVNAAQTLGFPVVVKPADRDQGHGAFANLQTIAEVRNAYALASGYSKRVLVERHIAGREYRLIVVQGELLWASERVPAQVQGDGQNDIQHLLTMENARRVEALSRDPTGWRPIEMDAELQSYMQETGWSLKAVPAAGQTVRLQRVPAATTGGGGLACFETLHPDNRQLAERAAKMLRLDIAGVDLIMPDISRSWREAGGALTEVNAMPQISIQTNPRLIEMLLERVMPEGGRIPVIVILGVEAPLGWLQVWRDCFNEIGLTLGYSTPAGLGVGEATYLEGRTSAWDHTRALQMDTDVGAICLLTDGVEFLKTGLPFDRFDILLELGKQPQAVGLMRPYCSGLNVAFDNPLPQSASLPGQRQRDLPPSQGFSLDKLCSHDWVRRVIATLNIKGSGHPVQARAVQ